MPLPDVIEIEPLSLATEARIRVPGSKSITNRAMILAALGQGITTLEGALWSDDTRVMLAALERLGFHTEVTPDPREPANRTIRIGGRGGVVPGGGSPESPLTLHVGNAGTAARFLMAFLCLGRGVYRLEGVPRMHERPQAGLIRALRALGYRIDAPNDRLPAIIHGGGPRPGRCVIGVEGSSQFASALILAADAGRWQVEVAGSDAEELPYVEMTRQLVRTFRPGGVFPIEPDASSGSYFWGADALLGPDLRPAGRIRVEQWPASGWQADAAFPRYLPPPAVVSRATDLADSIMTAIVLAPFSRHPVRFTDLGRLRVQECERVAALRTELTRCGADVEESGDSLVVTPGPALHGAEIETYGDHRMAMAFGMLGLRVTGIRIRNPRCVDKTFPNFFAKLAAPPPGGLGAVIRDGRTMRPLGSEELVAG